MPKVIINGPECSGKTTLCEYLVKKMDAGYIQEYPRIYLDITDGEYVREDLLIMASDIDDLISELDKDKLWIIDTNIINIKIWYEHKYGEEPVAINHLSDNAEAIHLLCSPDIPWEEDPFRESANERPLLMEKYIKYYEDNQIPYQIISGLGESRLERALERISNTL